MKKTLTWLEWNIMIMKAEVSEIIGRKRDVNKD